MNIHSKTPQKITHADSYPWMKAKQRNTPNAKKLAYHIATHKDGKIDPKCNACKELSEP